MQFGDWMEHVIFNGREIEYSIIRKNVKNINLRIRQDSSVVVSASPLVPKAFIEAFVTENAEKILKAMDKMNAKAALQPEFENGSTVKLLGKSYTLEIIESSSNSYYVDENKITLYVKESDKMVNRQSTYNLLLVNTSKVVFPKLLKECYPPFEKVCGSVPELKIKTLKSQWGNCYHKRNLITLNSRLAAYDFNVIRSVIYHEYCHFVHHNHSKEFYSLLGSVMPDWKRYDRVLKQK